MQIRFTSALTSEDENRLAPELLRLVTAILDLTPVAYAMRIETSDGQIYRHSHPCCSNPLEAPARAPDDVVPPRPAAVRMGRGRVRPES